MKRIHAACGLAAMLAVAACDEGPTTTVSYKEDAVHSAFLSVVARGPMPVIVHGDPFSEGDAVDQRVLDAMKEVQFGRVVDYALAEPDFPGKRRVILVLNGSGATDGDICEGEQPATSPAGSGEITIRMVFCNGDEREADVRGRSPNFAGSGHEFFGMLIRSATRSLFGPDEH
jgi:hypothetical protein